MENLGFEKVECKLTLMCITENNSIENISDIESELESGLENVAYDLIVERNNVVAFEVSNVESIAIGDDKKA